MQSKITAVPIVRDNFGYWVHPGYSELFEEDRNYTNSEFDAVLKSAGLESSFDYLDDEDRRDDVDGADISYWNPTMPEGNGWFLGSIHDTEDGAMCVWLRDLNFSEPVIVSNSLDSWFGLSYASFLVLPRVAMDAMPPQWRESMAELLKQYTDQVKTSAFGVKGCRVQALDENGKLMKMPEELVNYRHPSLETINELLKK